MYETASDQNLNKTNGTNRPAVISQNTNGLSNSTHLSSGPALKNEDKDSRCGCCWCYPACLQPCARPVAYLLCISALFLTQSMFVSGYISSIVTTLERRFEITSQQSGLIISSYEWTSIIAVLIVSYYGDQYNRARWLGRGALLISFGAFVFMLPHFISDAYEPDLITEANEASEEVLCHVFQNGSFQQDNECVDEQRSTWVMANMMVGEMLIGIGSSPIYTLGPTYLYDNVKPQRYTIYLGKHFVLLLMCCIKCFLMFNLHMYVRFIVHYCPFKCTKQMPV